MIMMISVGNILPEVVNSPVFIQGSKSPYKILFLMYFGLDNMTYNYRLLFTVANLR